MSKLHSLSVFCNFGAALNSMLQECLVCSIQDDQIQKRLLAESNLMFPRAMELAQDLDAAARNVHELHSPQQTEGEVHQVRPAQKQ